MMGAKPQAVVTDVDDAGKILAAETIWCDMCGASFPLWPPEELLFHTHAEHGDTFWPQLVKMWDEYHRDKDLARRANVITQYRVSFLFLILERRFDLYQKLTAAGVLVPPRQG